MHGLLHTYHSKGKNMPDLIVRTVYGPKSLPYWKRDLLCCNPTEFHPITL